MLRTINCLFLVAMEVLLPNLQMGWQERIKERSSNLPQSYICCSKVVPCKNMKQSSHCMNYWQCQKITKNTWNDSYGWTMVEFVHQEVMKGTKAIVGVVWYVVLSCDEVFTIDNQSWLFVHCYVVHNWVWIPIFIFLNRVLEGSSSENLTKVIMEMLTIGGGFIKNQITQKFICFGANGVNVFQGTKNGVTKYIHDTYALHSIKVHCMTHHINLLSEHC